MVTRKKRILLLGDARQVHIKRWSRYLIDSGYDVITASLDPIAGVPGRLEQIRIPDFLPDVLRYPMAVPAARRIIRRFSPHLVNAHFTPNYGVIAALSGFQPWVLSTWGSDIMLLPQRSPFHSARTRYVIKRAASITSDADVMSERLVTLGADPNRVVTFPFGVDRNVFYPVETDGARHPGGQTTGAADAEREKTRRRGPAAPHARVLSNRKHEAVYNIDTIISAWPQVARVLDTPALTVAGTGSLSKKLRASAQSAPGIDFTGDVAHENIPALLRKHDIFVSIASSDTTSVSLLEAMACGLFPVVSDIPANREWIRHGKNGLLVPPRDARALADAVVMAWNNHELRLTAKNHNVDLIASRADWFENMKLVKNVFDRLIEPVKAFSRG